VRTEVYILYMPALFQWNGEKLGSSTTTAEIFKDVQNLKVGHMT